MVIVGVWRDAASTDDEATVDVDVIHDGQSDTAGIIRNRRRVRSFVEDHIDTHDLAANRNNRKGLSWIRRVEPYTSPLKRILRRRRGRTVEEAAAEVDRVGPGGRRRQAVESGPAAPECPPVP